MKKIYLVKGLEVGGEASDDITIGWTDTREKAERACELLKKQNEQELKEWEKHGCNCLVGYEAWKTSDDPKALEVLKKVKKSKCQHAASSQIKELFYGKECVSGGFEIVCGHEYGRCSMPCEYTYVVEEVEDISMI